MLDNIECLAWDYLTEKYTFYDLKGQLLSTQKFVNRMKEGEFTYYYPNTGGVYTRMFYIKNMLYGAKVTYHETGDIKTKEYYVNGLKQGRYINYDYNRSSYRVCWYKNGELHGPDRSYLKDKLYTESIYYHGTLIKYRSWTYAGNLKKYKEYNMCGIRHGYCCDFDDMHKIYYHGKFVRFATEAEKIEKGYLV